MGILLHQHDLGFVQKIQHLGSMTAKQELCIVGIGLWIGKQVEDWFEHVRVKVILEFINDCETADLQCLQQTRQQHKSPLCSAGLHGKRQAELKIPIFVHAEGDPHVLSRFIGLLRVGNRKLL